MKIQPYAYPALLVGALLLPAAAGAQTANLAVSIKINTTCAVNDATLVFPPQAGLNTSVDQTGDLQVTCTNGAPYNIGFGLGQNADGSQRRMKSADGNHINYQIYREAGRTTVLGTTIGTNTIAATGKGTADTKTVYGRVPAQPTAIIGDYTDTVLITVTY